MVRTLSVMWMAIGGALVAAPVGAQDATAPAAQSAAPPVAVAQPRPIDRSELRHQIYVMEGALARAVSFGAQRLNREIRNVVPEMVVLSGEPQARGVYLDGYGVFFDVGVPILRQSMVWSLRNMLEQDDNKRMRDAIALLKQNLNQVTDARTRAMMESNIAQLELQINTMPGSAQQQQPRLLLPPARQIAGGDAPVSPAFIAPDQPKSTQQTTSPTTELPVPQQAVPPAAPAADAGRIDRMFLQDPGRAYTESVQRALIEAMIDYSLPMALGPDEWLTVGARDNMQRDSLAPPDPFEEIVTILIRIKGSDLAAYRAAQIDRDEVRRRVQIREF